MIWVTIVLSIIAGFTIFWAGVISLIGFGGWRQLANLYPAVEWPDEEGITLSWQTATVGASNYGNVLKAVVAEAGLYLRPARLFAFNHPPVHIPWGSIAGTSAGFLGGLKLHLDGEKTILLRGKVAAFVQNALDAYDAAGHERGSYALNELEAEESATEPTSVRRSRTRT